MFSDMSISVRVYGTYCLSRGLEFFYSGPRTEGVGDILCKSLHFGVSHGRVEVGGW